MLRKFTHGNFNLNIIINENNDLLFFGKEVAEILGYKETRKALQRHVDPEDKIEFKDFEGAELESVPFQYQSHRILIHEPGFYALIFGSKKQQAREFKKWFFEKVFPQLSNTLILGN